MEGGILIGQGAISWSRGERISDRYGVVGVFNENSMEQTVTKGAGLDLNKIEQISGTKGQLVCEVIETRQSTHIGDIFNGFFPITPEMGEIIILGSGSIFHENTDGFDYVGLEPEDERETFWLNPEMLYRAHEQTVKLYFIPE